MKGTDIAVMVGLVLISITHLCIVWDVYAEREDRMKKKDEETITRFSRLRKWLGRKG